MCTFNPGSSAAAGDSGGPFVVGYGENSKLAGVVSFGIPPKEQNPSMHSNFFVLSDFIDDVISGIISAGNVRIINGIEPIGNVDFKGHIIINSGGELVVNNTLDMIGAESKITSKNRRQACSQ